MERMFKTARYGCRLAYVYFRSAFAAGSAQLRLARVFKGELDNENLDHQRICAEALTLAANEVGRIEDERERNGERPLGYRYNRDLVFNIMESHIDVELMLLD